MVLLTKNYEAEIRALCADGGEDARRALVCALADGRPAVARAARMALAERFVVHRDWLLQVYKAAQRTHTRTQVLALLARGGRADSMVSLLEAAAAVPDRANSLRQACRHLEVWLAQWAPLSPRDTCRLAAAVLDAEHVLPAELAERLWAYLRGQRRLPRSVRLPKVPLRAVPVGRAAPDKRDGAVRGTSEYFDGRVRHRAYEMAPTWWGRFRGAVLGVVEGVK